MKNNNGRVIRLGKRKQLSDAPTENGRPMQSHQTGGGTIIIVIDTRASRPRPRWLSLSRSTVRSVFRFGNECVRERRVYRELPLCVMQRVATPRKQLNCAPRNTVTAVSTRYISRLLTVPPAMPAAATFRDPCEMHRRGFRDKSYFAEHSKARKLYESLQFRD